MAKELEQWIKEDVKPYRSKSLSWLSSNHFFRDPIRGAFVDSGYFFSPADGIILYQCKVKPGKPIVEIKGRCYTLQDALFDQEFDKECLVIGIFMTFYDPHINRIPYAGRLHYQHLAAIESHNAPMLDIEKKMIDELGIDEPDEYLFLNERMLNIIYSQALGRPYYLLQIADYDVDCICHFNVEQNRVVNQGDRFSMIRYGSQVDLIIPINPTDTLELVQNVHSHVEAGVDALVSVRRASENAL